MVKMTATENGAGTIGIHLFMHTLSNDQAAAASKMSTTPRLNSMFPKSRPPAMVKTTPMTANTRPA